MKFQMVSDLHLEWGPIELPETDADLIVLAGDIREGTDALPFVYKLLERGKPVLYVPGNHEYYSNDVSEVDNAWGAIAAFEPNLHYAAGGTTFEVAGVKVVAATLWSNFWGDATNQWFVRQWINDFRLIQNGDHQLRTEEVVEFYERDLAYLRDHVTPGCLVVTHFAPSRRSIHPKYLMGPASGLNCYYCNDLDMIVEGMRPEAWVHGHTHTSFDYRLGGTRVLCNPRGYATENPDFDPGKVVQVGLL